MACANTICGNLKFNLSISSTNNSSVNKPLPTKPIPLRIIFILNALMMILPFVFYYVITSKGIEIGGLDPNYMIYTSVAYIISFAILVYFILNRNIKGLRIIFMVNILIAIPAKAFIGIGVAIISLLISFLNQKVKAYFLV